MSENVGFDTCFLIVMAVFALIWAAYWLGAWTERERPKR
jgi:hypothetical protein